MKLGALAPVLAAVSLVAACVAPERPGPTAVDAEPAYPAGPYAVAVGATLPDLAFDGVSEEGERRTIHLHDFLAEDAAAPPLLVVRVTGGLWCGTCRWQAEHTSELAQLGLGTAFRELDLVIGNRDADPATAPDALAWRALLDDASHVTVGADPGASFGAISTNRDLVLPLFVFVDARTMRVLDDVSNPDPGELSRRIAALAPGETHALDDSLVDGLFHRNEWDLLRAVTVPGAPPPDPTNRVADRPEARALGRALFFDAGLSPSGAVSCATCHDPKKNLADGLPRGRGVAEGDRLTPSIALAAHARWQFWDGRAETLWAQALGPIESAREMGSSRLFVAARVESAFADAYAAAFPDEPLPDLAALPASGKPGDAAFDALSSADREAVTRVFVNVGKAIEAYERSFRVKPNRFDAFLAGRHRALGAEETLGLVMFVRSGCMQCHWGPRLTDDAFHDTRLPTGRLDGRADPGRVEGLASLLGSEFRASGSYSDAPLARPPLPEPSTTMLGRFKTPALRGVGGASHYGHGGTFDVLAGVTEAYGRGGVPDDDPASAGVRDRWLMTFGESTQWGLVPFLRTLTAEPTVP